MNARVFHILKKEFLQLVRTPALMAILVICPIITVGLVPFGLGCSVKLRLDVVDESFSEKGRETVSTLAASPYVISVGERKSAAQAYERLDSGESDAVIIIERDGKHLNVIDGSHLFQARNALYYIEKILSPEYDIPVRIHTMYVSCPDFTHYYIVPMIVMLIAIISCCLPTLSVVKEMETKVLEHLRSTGLEPSLFVMSKTGFFVVVALLEAGLSLIIARIVFGFSCAGPVAVVFLLFAVFLFTMSNLGITFAVCGKTLVRSIYILVFSFLILILLSTMFAPLDNMSDAWAATRFANPFYWAIDGASKIMLKGVGLSGVFSHICMLSGMGTILSIFNIVKIGNTE